MINILVLVPVQTNLALTPVIKPAYTEYSCFQKAYPLLSKAGCETLSLIQKHPSFCLLVGETHPDLDSLICLSYRFKGSCLIPYLVYSPELNSKKDKLYLFFSQNMSTSLKNSYSHPDKVLCAFDGIMPLDDPALKVLINQIPVLSKTVKNSILDHKES